ncbi:TM0106 family RecB-like putative nuclease [Nocardioides caldifontis]|uniref:TM0106 family RecB-like putative nuclease n=1 Tax=Nocardioides caldifontis TaxID=2588938 RepID=UPI0011DF153E|nr:bifunctional RecB family nuclease/DEAD/DEAH box helicase [Nocardioides caldifontis]
MRLVDGRICWSPSDLTAAATCEFSVLRALDELLGRGCARPDDVDPLRVQVARVGDLHEREVREQLESGAARFVELPRPTGWSADELAAMHQRTLTALRSGADVVYQAGFFDGELVGFADFLVSTDEGWVVSDAKLARQARPTALLQLGAYADQVAAAGLPLARVARLLLGDGSEDVFPLVDVLPVFRERRARLRSLLDAHRDAGPVEWGAPGHLACGRCADCQHAVEEHRDLLLVAGMRMSQRTLLRDAGVTTLDGLVAMEEPPEGMVRATFDKLVAQARLQARQLAATAPGEEPVVLHELVDGGAALARLPEPSEGDIFFDFEGDPLYREADPAVWGLEYLWGVIEAPVDGRPPEFVRWWAHDRREERKAFVEFMEYVAERRAKHPGMHVYHYAPYETAALKRLAGRYATKQSELDELLRSAVFVDLYSVVRSSVRVSQPSYSIKKLEPLYMGAETRAGMAVAAGDASVAEYHESRALRARGLVAEADDKLAALESYNRYDCVSTLELRDWLARLAAEQGITPVPAPVVTAPVPAAVPAGPSGDDERARAAEERDRVVAALRARSGPDDRTQRTADEQVHAMLASAIGYHRRESLPHWWEHFNRLATPDLDDWRPDRDVYRVEGVVVLEDWHVPEGRQVLHRRLRLRGAWGPGSTPGERAGVVYRVPCPEGATVPEKCDYGYYGDREIEVSEEDQDDVVLTEKLARGAEGHAAVPVALVPASPPNDASITGAITEVARQVLASPSLPEHPALDVLRRRPPRLRSMAALPHTGHAINDLVATLLDLDRSYVPVQGPPGTGKTWTGSRVVKELVEQHGWRIGVVAQSHAVVENMLSAVCKAGLDPSRIGKKGTKTDGAVWVELDGKQGRTHAAFLEEHDGTGCVLGGTAWTFTSDKSVARGSLDLLVIDEAGQFALANTVAVSVAAKRLLLLGDPQQLPQVSKGTHDEPVFVSALRWVMHGADTLPQELGYFLEMTWRMHPALCEKVSTLSYAGELRSAPATAARRLEGVAPGLRTVCVAGVSGTSVESEEEALAVVEEVRSLVGRSWHDPGCDPADRPLAPEDVLVVAPYNAQVQLVRQRLREAGLPGVRVGTVDKFQGQEAPVVIVSMTAASAAEVPRGMGFLLSRNRVNVAISRAQWLAVLVRSKELTSYLPRSPKGVLELGAFIGLSGDISAR